jgi:hypothetical protein
MRAVACRVRIRLSVGNRVFEGKALLNSGFESDAPDIIVPVYKNSARKPTVLTVG